MTTPPAGAIVLQSEAHIMMRRITGRRS